MIWNYTDIAVLTMKQMKNQELKSYLAKIKDKELYAYNVYQIEGEGRSLFSKIEGDKDSIMGLQIKQIKEYLKKNPKCILLDVRTKEEWNTIGKPDGEKIGLKTHFLSIQFGEERIFNENFEIFEIEIFHLKNFH